MALEQKKFRLEIKTADLQEDGTFTGLASTYGNVDQGGDVVNRGAFTKTLKERGNEVPILWSHDSKQPVGLGSLEDSTSGLVIKGKLNLDTQIARDVYSNLKARIVKGLSIGFETVDKKIVDGIRQLTELKLFEVSLCLFPMNEQAEVYGVKTRQVKDDFLTELDDAQTWSFRYMAMGALQESLCETMMDGDMTPEEITAQSSIAILQFHDKYLEMLPKMLAVMADQGSPMYYARTPAEAKAGRKLSAATRKRIEEALAQLQTLLSEAVDIDTSEAGAVMTETDKVKAISIGPDQFHALLGSFTKSITGELNHGTDRSSANV